MKQPPKELLDEMDVLAKQHYTLLKKYYEKSQVIRITIVSLFQAVLIFCILMTIIKYFFEN